MNQMMKRTGLILAAVLLAAAPVHAKIYRYTDASGVTVFTDNLVDVPADQRQGIQQMEEIISPAVPARVEKKRPAIGETPLSEKERLAREKEGLDREYDALVLERKALKNSVAPKASAGYKRQVAALNKKIKVYDLKRQAFAKRLTAYNAALSGE